MKLFKDNVYLRFNLNQKYRKAEEIKAVILASIFEKFNSTWLRL